MYLQFELLPYIFFVGVLGNTIACEKTGEDGFEINQKYFAEVLLLHELCPHLKVYLAVWSLQDSYSYAI